MELTWGTTRVYIPEWLIVVIIVIVTVNFVLKLIGTYYKWQIARLQHKIVEQQSHVTQRIEEISKTYVKGQ